MTSDAPGPGTPGSGPPPGDDATQATPTGEWPTELVPPTPAPAAPAPAPAPGTWGAPPAQPAAPTPQTPAPATPQPAAPAWGAPPAGAPAAAAGSQAPAPQPAAPAWGTPPDQAPAPQAPAPRPAAPAWGTPPGQAPAPQAPAPGAGQWGAAAPPPTGGWGAPPPGGPQPTQPGGPQPTQPGQWGAPPQQAGGWSPAPGAPGGVPPAGWGPQPAQSSNNGCLKACLIVGAILIVVAILVVVAFGIFANRLLSDAGINGDGTVTSCPLISEGDIQAVLGPDAKALPMGGLVDVTFGQALDKRILKDAQDCWAFGDSSTGSTTSVAGRLARQEGGDAGGDFARARAAAEAGGYLDTANRVSGLGDEAFCTTLGETGSAGVLVRSGGRLVYVSLVDPETISLGGESDHACRLAQDIAARMLR